MSPQGMKDLTPQERPPASVNEALQARAKLQNYQKVHHHPCSPNPRLMSSWSTPESKEDYVRRSL